MISRCTRRIMSIASAAPAGRTRWATPSALSRRRTGTNCGRWSGSSAAASSGSGRKVLIIRPRRHRDNPPKLNVVSRRDRIMAGRSNPPIRLRLIVPGSSRDIIISIQARPAVGGGKRTRTCFRNGQFWTAAASVARRRFGKRSVLFLPAKALSSLRSASAVQKADGNCQVLFRSPPAISDTRTSGFPRASSGGRF